MFRSGRWRALLQSKSQLLPHISQLSDEEAKNTPSVSHSRRIVTVFADFSPSCSSPPRGDWDNSRGERPQRPFLRFSSDPFPKLRSLTQPPVNRWADEFQRPAHLLEYVSKKKRVFERDVIKVALAIYRRLMVAIETHSLSRCGC